MVCNLHFVCVCLCVHVCVCVSFIHRESSSISLLLADPRVNLLTNGGLEVSNVSQDDEGIYTCSIQNSNVSVSAELEVLSEWERLSHRDIVCPLICSSRSLSHWRMSPSIRQVIDPVAPTSSEDAAWKNSHIHLPVHDRPQTALSGPSVEEKWPEDLWVTQWWKVRSLNCQ